MFEGGWALAPVWYPTPTILLGLSWLVNQLWATERARGLELVRIFWFACDRNPVPTDLCCWGGWGWVVHRIKSIAAGNRSSGSGIGDLMILEHSPSRSFSCFCLTLPFGLIISFQTDLLLLQQNMAPGSFSKRKVLSLGSPTVPGQSLIGSAWVLCHVLDHSQLLRI